jgi:hypothetical protein
MGAFSDGRFTYFLPNANNESSYYHGNVVRVNNQDYSSSGVSVLNTQAYSSQFIGFHGGFTDGVYGYLVPYATSLDGTGTIVRFGLERFSTSDMTALNLQSINRNYAGYSGGFTDGSYGYFVPRGQIGSFTGQANFARVALWNFTTSGTTMLNIQSVDAQIYGYNGGFIEGRYAYLIPALGYSAYAYGHGRVARVDLTNFTTGGITILNLYDYNARVGSFFGGFSDGRYSYFSMYTDRTGGVDGLLFRVDQNNFTTSGITLLDLKAINGNFVGFGGAIRKGRYAYLVPTSKNYMVRVDLGNFTASGVESIDLSAYGSNMKGWWSGCADDKYVYLAPYNNGDFHGRILRFNAFSVSTGY